MSLTPCRVGQSRSCAELPQVSASRLGAFIPPRRGDEQRRPHSLNYRKLLSSASLLTLTVKCGGKLTFPPWGRPASESRGWKDGGGAAEPPLSPPGPSPDPDTRRGQLTKDATVTRTPCCRPLCETAGIVLVPGGPKSQKEGDQEGQNKQGIAQSFGKLGSAAVGVCRNDPFEQMLHYSD